MCNFKTIIKEEKERLGLSDAEFERRGGLRSGFYRDLLKRNHARYPSFDKLLKVCKALNKRPDELFPEIKDFYPPQALELADKIQQLEKEISKLSDE